MRINTSLAACMIWIAAAGISPASSIGTASAAPADLLVQDGLDTRQPLYLTASMAARQKQNMRAHLIAVQRIIAALQVGDYGVIGESAKEMGFSPQMGRMCEMMGAATPGFAEVAFKFHYTADEIGPAASNRDERAVLVALGKTLAICTACHASYVQKVVSDEEWEQMARKPVR